MHNNVKFVLVTRIFKCGGAAGIPIYPGGGRLCLSACPGDGEVKKKLPLPTRIISGTALRFSCNILTLRALQIDVLLLFIYLLLLSASLYFSKRGAY